MPPTDQGDFQIYVGNLDQNVTNQIMTEFFGNKYGFNSIIEAKVITDQNTKQSKGFGFVRFHSQHFAQKAMMECNGNYLLTKQLKLG